MVLYSTWLSSNTIESAHTHIEIQKYLQIIPSLLLAFSTFFNIYRSFLQSFHLNLFVNKPFSEFLNKSSYFHSKIQVDGALKADIAIFLHSEHIFFWTQYGTLCKNFTKWYFLKLSFFKTQDIVEHYFQNMGIFLRLMQIWLQLISWAMTKLHIFCQVFQWYKKASFNIKVWVWWSHPKGIPLSLFSLSIPELPPNGYKSRFFNWSCNSVIQKVS